MLLAANVSFLNWCHDVLLITYSTTKKLESKAFTVNSQNIKYVIDMQGTFDLKKNLKKDIF